MAKFETLVHEVSLDVVIAYYLKDLKIKEDSIEVSRQPFVDIHKNKLIVVIGVEKNDT